MYGEMNMAKVFASISSYESRIPSFCLADLILNVTTMRRAASMIGRQVTIYEIENAKHNVFLSKASVREKASVLMFRWLKHLEEDWMHSTEIS